MLLGRSHDVPNLPIVPPADKQPCHLDADRTPLLSFCVPHLFFQPPYVLSVGSWSRDLVNFSYSCHQARLSWAETVEKHYQPPEFRGQ